MCFDDSDGEDVVAEDEMDDIDYSVDWTCKKCSNVNKGEKKRCAQCSIWRFSRKRARLSSSIVEGKSNESATEDGGHWICKACSYDNFATEIQCLMCQKKRPNWKKYSKSVSSRSSAPGRLPLTNPLAASSHVASTTSGIGLGGVVAPPIKSNSEENTPTTNEAASDPSIGMAPTSDIPATKADAVSGSPGNADATEASLLHDMSRSSPGNQNLDNSMGYQNYLQGSPIAGHESFDYGSSYLHTGFLNVDTSTEYLASNNTDEHETSANDDSKVSDSIVQV